MRVLIALYAAVAAALGGYAAYGALHGEHWPFILVWGGLTLAWLFVYWPIAMPVYLLLRLHAIYKLVVANYRETGKIALDAESRTFLLEELIDLVAGQFGLPGFVAQWVVTRIVARIQRKRAAARAALPHERPQ
jgi:hypothetical protein